MSISKSNPQQFYGSRNATLYRAAGGGITAIVTPAQNTNGIIVYMGKCLASTGEFAMLLTDTSTPVNFYDGTALANHVYAAQTALDLQSPILLPSGYGLYRHATGATAVISALYEVL